MNGPVRRPSVPQAAWVALGMWAGCRAAEAVSWAAWVGSGVAGIAAIVLVVVTVLGVAGWRVRTVRALAVLTLCGMAAGACTSGLQAAAWHRQASLVADCGAREWTGYVEADPVAGEYGTSVAVRLAGGPLDGAAVRVRWPAGMQAPELGRTVRFASIIKPLSADDGWGRRSGRAGMCGSGSAWRAVEGDWRGGVMGALLRWRASTRERMRTVPGAGGALLEGIVLGDRRRLGEMPTAEDFRILGLSHLVAVSGTHLALACGGAALLCRALRMPRRLLLACTLVAGCAYACVTGLPNSALRALLMVLVGGAGVVFGRRADGLASLAVAVIAVLAVEPWTVFDLGFQLSVLAVGGLLLFGTLATVWAAHGMTGPLRSVSGTLALTCVAQVFTAPVVASTFGMLSVIAPLANAYAAPLVSLGLCLGLAGAVIGSAAPALGDPVVSLAAVVLEITAWLSGHLARAPGAAVAVGSGVLLVVVPTVLAAVVWIRWPIPRGTVQARALSLSVVGLCVALALGPVPARSPTMVVLDVGQADAILLQDGGRTMLVDVGPDPTTMRRALARAGIRRLDVVVLTHAHADHTGGAPGLSGVTSVGWVGVPSVGSPCVEDDASWIGPQTAIRALSAGDSWSVGSTNVRVLWPPAEPEHELHTNDTSVVLQLTTGQIDSVLTGDAETEAQRGMIANGAVTPIEVLKVPHHGSVNGLTAESLALWDPEVALVSVGTGNRFDHPSPETMELLMASGVEVLRTDHVGDITVRFERDGYRVTADRRRAAEVVRARMGGARVRTSVPVWAGPGAGIDRGARADRGARVGIGRLEEERHGSQEHRRPQARLPDLRRRGAAARARAPPPAPACRRGGRSGFQLRYVRRGVGRSHRRGGRCQHSAVRIRSTARRRAQHRQDAGR